jgi:hypothetical protein
MYLSVSFAEFHYKGQIENDRRIINTFWRSKFSAILGNTLRRNVRTYLPRHIITPQKTWIFINTAYILDF